MKKTIGVFCLFLMLLTFLPLTLAAEESQVVLRTLKVDWYAESREGVKIIYRDFNNKPHALYLPKSFHKKYYRYVEAPKYAGSIQGVPLMLVHMKDGEVRFIDIYTEFQRATQKIAEFNQNDLDKFQEAEQKGVVELQF